jgi:UDP-N-acetylglucosamine acyltransferase
MAQVHPTAIVDPKAVLGEGVTVGPYCIIEGAVTIGDHTTLMHHVTLKGPLSIGRRNTIYPNAAIGYEPQDRKFDPRTAGAGVLIGDDNVIREGVTIHRATKDRPTTLGHRNYLMVNSHLGHDDVVGNDNTFANGVLLAGHVEIGDRVTLGGNAVVHQFCRVGRLAMMSGVEGITQDLPPFCIVYHTRTVGSLNLIGLRRSGHQKHIDNLRRAFRLLFHSRMLPRHAADVIAHELAHDELCMELVNFVRSSKRGITGADRTEAPIEEKAQA